MKKYTIMFIILALMILPVNAAVNSREIQQDQSWTYGCGDGINKDCPDTHDYSPDTISNITARMIDAYVTNSTAKNESIYILASQPSYSGNERISRYGFSISPSGVTESFTEISDKAGTDFRSNTASSCQGFLSGNSGSTPPDLLQALHTHDRMQQPRGELRAKDIIVREYPGIARVCMENSGYWDGQESDRQHEYFFVDSRIVIIPSTGTDRSIGMKNKAVTVSFNASQNISGLVPLHNQWIIDPAPGTSPLEVLEDQQKGQKPVPWYENYRGPFGSSVALGSEDINQYDWRIITGFFSHYADRPVGFDPHLGIVINETEAKDGSQHRLISTQFDGTRGWCSITNWTYHEYPDTPSFFGSGYMVRWTGNAGA